MWIFTPVGFFSVVQPRNDAAKVMVRARVKSDLTRLREFIPELSAIKTTTDTDYRYRAVCSKEQFAAGLSKFVLESLNYGNFKSEVAKRQGMQRESIYHEVWAVLHDGLIKIDRDDAEKSRNRSGSGSERQ